MKVAYIIDSTAGISEELANHPDVYTVTLTINLPDGQTMNDTTDPELMKKFYNELTNHRALPTTSQPEPSEYVEILENIKAKNYDTIFGIFLSGAISGTLQVANLALNELASGMDVLLVDSKGTSYLSEDLLIQAMKMVDTGLDAVTIKEKLDWVVDNSRIYVVIEDDETLQKGGRVNSFESFFGSALSIRPILYFNDEGKVTVFEKVRTDKRVFKRLAQLVDEAVEKYPNGIKIAFAHGDAWDEIAPFKESLAQKYPDLEFRIGYLTPVLGTHGGNGSKGMGIIAQAEF